MANGNALQRRFQLEEQRLRQRESQRADEQKKALKRQFASLGALGSGAQIKVGQQAEQAAASRLESGLQGLQSQRLGVEEQREAEQRQRDFASEQARLGRELTSEQARLGREFQSSERSAAQDFASEQARLGREFTSTERLGAQEFQKGLFDIQNALALDEFDLNQFVTLQNLNIARGQLGIEPITLEDLPTSRTGRPTETSRVQQKIIENKASTQPTQADIDKITNDINAWISSLSF